MIGPLALHGLAPLADFLLHPNEEIGEPVGGHLALTIPIGVMELLEDELPHANLPSQDTALAHSCLQLAQQERGIIVDVTHTEELCIHHI